MIMIQKVKEEYNDIDTADNASDNVDSLSENISVTNNNVSYDGTRERKHCHTSMLAFFLSNWHTSENNRIVVSRFVNLKERHIRFSM